MSLLGKTSLSTRMLLSIGGAVLLAFGTTISVVAVLGERDARAGAMAMARQTALTEASRISNEINQASAHAQGLAASLAGIRESQKLSDRELLSQLLRQNLERNPKLLGVWCVWEPNALDNKDASHANTPGSDAQGRYVAYWNRVGGVHLETCVDYDKPAPASDYYLRPLKSGKEVIMEPAVYKIGGKDVMVVSICIPIRSQDKTLGVAGVDFSMEQFQGMVSAIKPYDTGYGFLLANNGAVVAYPEAGAVGKDISEIIQDDKLGTCLKTGTDYQGRQLSVLDKSPCQVTAVPIQIGETGTPWMLGVATPEDKMLASAIYLRDLCILIGGGALLLVLGIVWLIARKLSKPLVQIAEGLNAFADQLAGSANEVAQTGNAIAQGASESAAAIEETSASMQEINSIIARNASSSIEASQVVKATSGLIEGTNHKMAGLKSSMDDISASSRETQQIVKTIDEIAFQTNILALNAAVEAARAGEAGAGFAVVADEVRSLAQRAAEAARNTSSLIEGSVGKISSATEMSGQTSADFTKVNQSSRELAGFITQIAESSGQQQSGIAEVTKAVNELNQVVQRNAALAEESSAAAQELNAQASQLQTYAHKLKDLVG